jgi:flagellar basal-body rod protein FlgG
MLNELEIAGNAMQHRMTQLEVVSNNLANANTVGYKRDDLFVHELDQQIKELAYPHSGSTKIPNPGELIDFSQGALVGTDRPFDVALSGNGLFTVQTPTGLAYTRDGRFMVDSEGILTTIDGYPVLGEGGEIEIDLQQYTDKDLTINDVGEIILDNNVIDKLQIVAVGDPRNFIKTGSNLFRPSDPQAQPVRLETPGVRHKFLEQSNVNPVDEMVAMMEIFHFYQTSQKMIQAQDSTLNKAVNSIGRVT